MKRFYSLTVLFLLGIVSVFAQSITLSTPNGGEVWDNGTTQNIIWSTTGSLPQVDILYSTDNGTTYNNIVTGITNNNTYAWVVPDTINSTNCKIIVIDSQTNNFFDESNQVFTIKNGEIITLVQPNGGETLTGGNNYSITWNSTNVAYLFIDFSSDGGATWQLVNDGIPGASGDYNWTVPNITSSNCLIRITSHSDANAIDSSASTFTINSVTKTLTLTTPNGGENLYGGSGAYNYVTWSSLNVSGVDLYYSTDNGSSYALIATNAPSNDGNNTYFWVTPNTPSSQCLVKVVDHSQSSLYDVSNAAFTISNAIVTVTNPNGGENYTAGSTVTLNWYSQGLSSYVNLYYSTDGGSSWNYIAYTNNTNNSANNVYSWAIPQGAVGCAKIKVEDYNSSSISDVNDACFSITAANPNITLISPNGGEQWTSGTYKNIVWNTQNVSYVNLEYSTNGGFSWNTIATSVTASSGTYSWYVPNAASNTVKVRVIDAATSQSDVSAANFSILNPVYTVVSPNGSEVINSGATYNIYVSNSGSYSYANIDYSINGGASWTNIVTSWYIGQSNTNSYGWTVPNTASTNCLIKVTDYTNSSLSDISDAPFTIVLTPPTFMVTSPTYNQVVISGNATTIAWNATNSNLTQLDYSVDSGLTWNLIANNVVTYTGSNSYNWTTPTGINSAKCLVRVSDQNNLSYYDVNGGAFSIVPQSITVTNANGGEVLQLGSTYDIRWNTIGGSGYVTIEYRTSPTGSWNTIVSGTSNSGTYNWVVSGLISNTCKFRVTDYSIGTMTDVSDYNFTIAADQAASITLTSLNGGDVVLPNTAVNISWNYSGVSNVMVEYNLNGNSPAGWVTAIASTSASAGYYAWTTPSTVSNTVRVRISDAANAAVSDISYANFAIKSNALQLTSPNGGENWVAGSTQNITWNSTGLSPYDYVYYSIDGGANWTFIAYGYNSQSYLSWTIPSNLASTNCLIRIDDYNNQSITDNSNSIFTISASAPTLTLTSFDGGQDVVVGTTQTINWSYNNVTTVKLEYSKDNGASWIYIDVAAASSGAYSWVVPNTPSTTCKIRISDNTNANVLDVSSYNFSITAPSLVLLYPNGGETYTAGTTTNISWVSTGLSPYDYVYYSIDGGANWVFIAYGYNSQSYLSWTIPSNISSTNCLIRIDDYNNQSITDNSNATFTINPATPAVTISAPNGGETFTAATSATIQWTSVNINKLKLEYSVNNGGSWSTIVDSTAASANSYAWTVPSILSNTVKVRATNTANSSVFDVSNNYFAISVPSLILIAPNGGENWAAGSTQTISWVSTGLSAYDYVYYSIDGGANWTFIGYGYNSQSYLSWTIPTGISSSNCLIRIDDYNNTSYTDNSNSTFTIGAGAPTITLSTPNGGESWAANTTQTITWSANNVSTFNIEYSTNNGSTWNFIASTASLSYNWSVPNTQSTTCLVRVSDASNASTNDVSASVFTITSPVFYLTAPNGGETWQEGTTHTITWVSNGLSPYVYINYSIDGGANWTFINYGYNSNNYSYDWTIPGGLASTNCLIKVYDYNNATYTDISDGLFTISAAAPTITLNTPNGGESWGVGTTQYVTWSSLNVSTVNLEYSTNGGSNWNFISSSTSTYLYWVVPNAISSNCLFRVSDASNASVNDVSSSVFSIINPSVTVTSPDGGQDYGAGTTQTLTWYSTGLSAYVNLFYSTDGGANWVAIANANNYNNQTSSYAWSIPSGIVSTNCLIKVEDYYAAGINDVSNAVFTIHAPTIALYVTSPNGGESWNAGTTYPITWYSEGLSPYVYIYYSIDGGSNWTFINYGYNSQGMTYQWSIPSNITSSTNCLIRVDDYTNTSYTDNSNAVFTINGAAPTITLSSPNGGESWGVATSQTITWSATGVTTFRVEYSIDGGSNWNFIENTTSQSSYWTVPNTLSNNCLVRVSDASNASLNDVSASVFSIVTPVVTVNTPDGGQDYAAGSTQTIYWYSTGLSAYVNISYSTDGGSNWTAITSVANYNNQSNSYAWSIPSGIASTNCLIKVEDYFLPSINDVSNAVFTIHAPTIALYLTSPNGGESWTAGTTYPITWYSEGLSPYVYIYYSLDAGANWTFIGYGYNSQGMTYQWNIPSNISSSTNCLIRIDDYSNTSYTDNSNALFTINGAAPSITLNSPNGGEVWGAGSTQNISWSATSVSNFNIEYSTDNGNNWTFVGTTSSQSYNWTVPNTSSTACLVRVSDASNASLNDVSSSVFTINTPTFVLTAPNGGETWLANSTHTITWNSQGLSPYVYIYYSVDGGSSWTFINYGYNSNNYSYDWTIPANLASNNCLIKINDYNNTSYTDNSNATFTIGAAAPSITVTAPNGGEAYVIGNQAYVNWTSISVTNVNIDYSTNGGVNWTSVATNLTASNGYYYWTVPNTPSTNCKVRISDASNSNTLDVSNNSFSISTPYITVTSPNGGEVWGIGSSRTITWSSAGVTNFNVYYSVDNGVSWNTVILNTNGSAYNVTIPNTPSTTCRVKVESSANSSLFDISNNTFTIPQPSVVLTTPNGGEQWSAGTNNYIYWTASGLTYVNLEYSIDGGSNWNNIVTQVSATNGYYNWYVPNNPSQACRVRVTDYYGTGPSDMSNANFAIVNPTITVTSQNAGASYIAGTAQLITWTSAYANSYVKIEYTTNGGSTWSTVSNAEYNDGNYNWTVPNTPSTNCYIKISDYYNNGIYDYNNAVFTILAPAPSLTVTSPNGGQNWSTGTNYSIQWNSVSVSSVKIEYSIDGGTSYNTIIAATNSVDGSNSYVWNVANTPSTKCLVKVTSAANSAVTDASDAYFTIPLPSLVLTSPNGNEVWGAGTSKYIYWTSASVANVKLEYTTNNGTIWNTIVASTPGNNGNYLWNIPSGINSTQSKVRIKSVINSSLVDESNFTFTIAPPSLTVTAPNGGETLTGLSNRSVSWTGVGLSSYVNIDYSTNGGTSWTNAATGAYNNGTYNWTVPNVASTNCKIRVTDYYNSALTDMSNAVFTINQATPTITVTTPNGGENYLVGSNYYIYWSSQSVQNVKIEYSIDGGANYTLISGNTVASQGYYYWYVPNTASTNCIVKVSDAANSSVSDISNATFKISQPIPSITVTSPNGGETFAEGSYQYITWSSQVVSAVNIEASLNGGSTWNTVATSVDATLGYYYTQIPTIGTTNSNCLIRISNSLNSALNDVSNSTFTIYVPTVNNNTITTTAVSDTMFCKGDSIYVNYVATGSYTSGNVFSVQLSDAAGNFSNPVSIGYKVSTSLADSIWAVIPESLVNGTDYRVRVVSDNLPATGTTNTHSININSPEFDFSTSDNVYIKYIPHGDVNFVFTPNSDSANYTYNWQFGTGDSSDAVNPTYEYTTPGFYTVGLTVTSAAGCVTNISRINYMDIEQIFPTIPTSTQGGSTGYSAISMYNQFTGITVGDNGTIQVTNNGGVSWTPVTASNVSGTLTGVHLVSADTAFAVSNTGSIYASYDAGLSWTLITNVGVQLNGIEFSGSTQGFAVGANGTIIKLDYNGSSWNPTTLTGTGITGNCNAVTAAGGVTGCVDAAGNAFVKDANGWNVGYTGSVALNGMNFLHPNLGYVVGDNGTIVRYKDGVWTKVYDGLTSNFKNIQIKDDLTAYAIGDDGVVYVTEDGGDNFDRYSLGNTSNMRGMAYKSGKGVIVGAGSVAFRFGGNGLGVGELNTTYCAGETFELEYFVSGEFRTSNTFRAELSDANADFTSAQIIGSVNSNTYGTMSVTLPADLAAGTGYHIRISSTDSAMVSADNGFDIEIFAKPNVNLGADTSICSGNSIVLNALNAGSVYTWSNDSTSQTNTINTAGGYTVEVTGANGCKGNDSIYVAVISTLAVNLGSDFSVCSASGLAIELNSNVVGATYSWSTGATTPEISATTTGTYSVTVSACSQTVTDAIVVTFNASPAVPTVTQSGAVMHAAVATTGVTYQWYKGNAIGMGTLIAGATADSLNPNDTGWFYVATITPLGCSSFSDPYRYSGVGYQDLALNGANAMVYPNPSTGLFTLQYTNAIAQSVTVRIVNVVGQTILEQEINSTTGVHKQAIDLNEVDNGMYFVTVYMNNTNFTQQITIQR